MEQTNHRAILWLSILFVYLGGDFATTYVILNTRGIHEYNIFIWIANEMFGFYSVAPVFLLSLLGLYLLTRFLPRQWEIVALSIFLGMTLQAVVMNVMEILWIILR